MKNVFTIGSLIAVVAFPALAQQITTTHLSVMDGNGDGAVDRAEFVAFGDRLFDSVDRDGNGRLSSAEAGPLLTAAQFTAVDTNGNGSISKTEFEAASSADFAAADRDSNGMLD